VNGKYGHLFVTHPDLCADDLVNEGAVAGLPRPANIGDPFGLMRAADFAGSKVHMAYSWIRPAEGPIHWVNEHQHEDDEVLAWLGSDQHDIHDLGAELYLDIEGERYVVTTSGSVYIPAGTRHCPLGFNSVSRPFIFISMLLNGTYASDQNMPG
jgi:hypothetical protein